MNEFEIDQAIEDLHRYKEYLNENLSVGERKFFQSGIRNLEVMIEAWKNMEKN